MDSIEASSSSNIPETITMLNVSIRDVFTQNNPLPMLKKHFRVALTKLKYALVMDVKRQISMLLKLLNNDPQFGTAVVARVCNGQCVLFN